MDAAAMQGLLAEIVHATIGGTAPEAIVRNALPQCCRAHATHGCA